MILKRMKRRHSRATPSRFCEEVRRLRPDIVFGADLIAGFPTETEAMFANSLRIVEDCGLTFLHVFPYLARGRNARRAHAAARPAGRSRTAPTDCAILAAPLSMLIFPPITARASRCSWRKTVSAGRRNSPN